MEKVTRKTSLLTGDEAIFIENVEDENEEIPVLNTPADSKKSGQTVQHNSDGVPILNAPRFKEKDVKNDPRLQSKIPVLNTPSDAKTKVA